MTNRKLVAIRPDWGDVACNWGSENIRIMSITKAIDNDVSVIDLYAHLANRQAIFARILEAQWVTLLGHGNPIEYTANMQEVIFRLNDPDTGNLCSKAGKKSWNFLSCSVGKALLPWMIEQGLGAARGYVEDFVFSINSNEFPDSIARPFFESHLEYDRVGLDNPNTTVQEAHEAALAKWRLNIQHAPPTTRSYMIHN